MPGGWDGDAVDVGCAVACDRDANASPANSFLLPAPLAPNGAGCSHGTCAHTPAWHAHGVTQILTRRQLNRALLARQMLLERVDRPVVEVVEHLAPMQAQVPVDPYVALWSRLVDFDPMTLSGLIERREMARGTLHRATLHLASARDFLAMRPLVQPVAERGFRTGSPFGRKLVGLDMDEVLKAAALLLDERPRTKAELRSLLGPMYPGYDADAIANGVAYLLPLVQVPPRGLWGQGGNPTLARLETWLGAPMDDHPSIEGMVLRYLGALGPASVMDCQEWCGLTRLSEVFEGLRNRLLTFRAETGRELFDLPDAPRPDAETPAPVRFLPQYDNLVLGHADRSRVIPDEARALPWSTLWVGSFLVDGMGAGTWRIEDAGPASTIEVAPRELLSPAQRAEAEAEAAGLVAFLRPKVTTHAVRFVASIG
jgi:DNA glycosylase AlkZ-like